MATNIKNTAGTDTDSLFYSGNSGLTTGFKRSDGTDLGALYLGYTTGAKVAATGLKNSAGTDFADLFQNIAVPPITNHTTVITSTSGTNYCAYEFPATSCVADEVLTATPSNGVGPFTYSWSEIADANNKFSFPGATTNQTCTVRSTASGGVYGATVRCTVTDTGNGNYQTTTDFVLSHTHEVL